MVDKFGFPAAGADEVEGERLAADMALTSERVLLRNSLCQELR